MSASIKANVASESYAANNEQLQRRNRCQHRIILWQIVANLSRMAESIPYFLVKQDAAVRKPNPTPGSPQMPLRKQPWPEVLKLSRTRTAVGFIEWTTAEANFVDDGLMISKTPTTVITGFPGAGKTTMIRHILENAEGHRIALV